MHGRNGPGNTDAEEDVHGVAASDVAYGGISVLVLDGGHLAGKSICEGEKIQLGHRSVGSPVVTNHGRGKLTS